MTNPADDSLIRYVFDRYKPLYNRKTVWFEFALGIIFMALGVYCAVISQLWSWSFIGSQLVSMGGGHLAGANLARLRYAD